MSDTFLSVRRLGALVVTLLVVEIVLALATIGAAVLVMQATAGIQTALDRGEDGIAAVETLIAQGRPHDILVMIWRGLHMLTWIAWLGWFHRAHRNLRAIGYAPLHASRWAIVAWLVPVVHLWVPFQIAREIWNASDPDPASVDRSTDRTPPLLAAWWLLWILGDAAYVMIVHAILVLDQANTNDVWTWEIVSLVIRVACGALAIPVVREITRRQEASAVRPARSQLTEDAREGLQRTFA